MANVHIWCGHESKSFSFNKIKSLAFKQELSESSVFEFSLLQQGHRWRLSLPGQRKGLLQSHLPRPLRLHSGQWEILLWVPPTAAPLTRAAFKESRHSDHTCPCLLLAEVSRRSEQMSELGRREAGGRCRQVEGLVYTTTPGPPTFTMCTLNNRAPQHKTHCWVCFRDCACSRSLLSIYGVLKQWVVNKTVPGG